MALALGLTDELEIENDSFFLADPQLMLDSASLKLAPFDTSTSARKPKRRGPTHQGNRWPVGSHALLRSKVVSGPGPVAAAPPADGCGLRSEKRRRRR